MKFIIASDIHGSQKYADKLVDLVKEANADKLLLLGDILYHGPRNPLPEGHNPQGVCSAFEPIKDKILCAKGNCDAEVDQMVLPFPCLNEYVCVCADGLTMYLSHGHRDVPPMVAGNVYLTGHTHVPLNVVEGNGYYHLNPGSTSLPKEGSANGYILYENRVFHFMTFDGVEYDKLDLS